MHRLLVMSLLASVGACTCSDVGPIPSNDAGDNGDAGPGCIEGLASISITPGNLVVQSDGHVAPIVFQATGIFDDGRMRDVGPQMTWAASRFDDAPQGSLSSQGVYQAIPGLGGVVVITATDGCKVGQTQLSLILDILIGNPDEATRLRFVPPPVITPNPRQPEVVYPSDETRFPLNTDGVLFQWTESANDYYRLTFRGPHARVQVFTDGRHARCNKNQVRCWESDARSWRAFAASNAGELVTFTVEGVLEGDPKVYKSLPVELGMSRRNLQGALYYWSLGSQGIRRASVNQRTDAPFLSGPPTPTRLPDGSEVQCAGCHQLSRDGRKMVAGTQTDGLTGLYVYDVTAQNPVPTPLLSNEIAENEPRSFASFSPDSTRVVASIGPLLRVFDTQTGAEVSGPIGEPATQPDWSPNGNQVVFVGKEGEAPNNADLKIVDYLGNDTWGPERTLVPKDGLGNLFPAFCPSGDYVAYARGKGDHHDKTAKLHIAKADGLAEPVELANANRVVSNRRVSDEIANTMPTWGPSTDLDWVAFSSIRPFGLVLDGGTQQIWIAGVDLQKLQNGEDPSYPAFRFELQAEEGENYRAFWAEDLEKPDGGLLEEPVGNPDGGFCLANTSGCEPFTGLGCCGNLVCGHTEDGTSLVCHE